MRLRVRYVRLAGLLVGAGIVVLTASAGPACQNATQVTVELRTLGMTCADLKGVAIVVARTPGDAENKMGLETLSAQLTRGQCGEDPRLLGTLVLTPSDSTAAIVVRARISDAQDANCKPPEYKGCIVSRRAFAFIDHASVMLPITLESNCLDVPCNSLTSCRSGVCVSSATECSEGSGTCESPAQPVVLADGGVSLPDGMSTTDGAADAPKTPDAADAGTDGSDDASDAATPVRKNGCPTQVGLEDCTGGKLCCNQMTTHYACLSDVQCSASSSMNPRYNCVGALPCPMDQYCCAMAVPGPAASNYCAMGCPSQIWCTVDGDCPSPKRCTGVVAGSDLGDGPFHSCELP